MNKENLGVKNCTLIGKNAGFWLKEGDEGYVVIGSFSDEEVASGQYTDCAIWGVDKKVIIKRNVLECLGIKEDSIN